MNKFVLIIAAIVAISGCETDPVMTNKDICEWNTARYNALHRCYSVEICHLNDREWREYKDTGIRMVQYCALATFDGERNRLKIKADAEEEQDGGDTDKDVQPLKEGELRART